MTLIEVLVALSLFAVMTTAVVPLIVTGFRAGTVAKMDTGAKNLAQQRFELMRNLPFRIGYDAAVTRSLDLLDTYYPNQVPPSGGVEAAGYVTTQARRVQEPSTGPFYRTRWDVDFNGGRYRQWVAVQFLSPSTKAPLAPATTYDANSFSDLPPSTLVGVTVTTEWQVGAMSKNSSAYTQIADAEPLAQLVEAQGRASAIHITTNLPYGGETGDVVVEGGLVSIDGGLGSGATAAVSATGDTATAFTSRATGVSRSASSPPDTSVPNASDTGKYEVSVGGMLAARIPASKVENVRAATSGGNPTVASSTSPVRAVAMGTHDLTLWPGTDLSDAALGLSAASPAVTIPASGSTEQAVAAGWLESVGGVNHQVTSSVAASTQTLNIMPTSFATTGLVQVRLLSSALTCTASATGTPTATTTYSAELRYWQLQSGDPFDAASSVSFGYGPWIALNHSQTSDPLQSVSLATDATGTPVVKHQDGSIRMLGHYIKSLSSQTAAGLAALPVQAPDAASVEAVAPSMVSVSTVPLRSGAPDSSVTVELGALSCVAEDRR